MYYLPRMPQTRIAAFDDTPQVERYLRRFLEGRRTWTELRDDPYLSAHIVTGEVHTPGVFEINGTYILSEAAQIDFHGRPRTLLVAYGPYVYVDSERSHAYRHLRPEPFRLEISALSYLPETFNLAPIYAALAVVEAGSATKAQVTSLLAELDGVRAQLETFRLRRDPLAAVLPALAAEAATRETRIANLQQQITLLQRPEGIGVTFPVDYPSQAYLDVVLATKVDKGLVEALVASKAPQADFDTHILGRNPHRTRYVDVGASSRPEFLGLLLRFNTLLARVTGYLEESRIESLVGQGDVTVTNLGGGQWAVDGSLVTENLAAGYQIEHRFTESGRLYALRSGRIVGGKAVGEVTVTVGGAVVYAVNAEIPQDLVSPPEAAVASDALIEVAFTGESPEGNLLQLRIEEG